ncbi:hypothetical protein TYRP_017532 [Tyrophagus putrescentiae]|nr:hypothetical protein TYRP_017532 [Tyrophagus putrescentiae]
MVSNSLSGPLISHHETVMADPPVVLPDEGATTGRRELSWWDKLMRFLYSEVEFECYMRNKDKKKETKKKKARLAKG